MQNTIPFIFSLDQVSRDDVLTVGGKGASLGEMTQMGLPVPPGFVISTECFEFFLSEAGLRGAIQAQMEQVDHHDLETIERASEQIQKLILNAEIPNEIRAEVYLSFDRLGAEYVAVRSSATTEDGLNASWAGGLESYLNTPRDELLGKVQKCWASLFTTRAIYYRFEKESQARKVSVAVVVQMMINATVSGVAFSVHPVTEDPNQMIIEGGWGLGDAIVSGVVTPDSYVVDKRSFSVIDMHISYQELELNSKLSGGTDWNLVPQERRTVQKLSSSHVRDLSNLVVLIERYFGYPCDIEWAMEKGTLYIVQCRPITTLHGISIPAEVARFDPDDWHLLGSWPQRLLGIEYWFGKETAHAYYSITGETFRGLFFHENEMDNEYMHHECVALLKLKFDSLQCRTFFENMRIGFLDNHDRIKVVFEMFSQMPHDERIRVLSEKALPFLAYNGACDWIVYLYEQLNHDRIYEEFKKYYPDDYQAEFPALIAPAIETETQREQVALLDAALQLFKGEDVETLSQNLAARFGHLPIFIMSDPYSPEYYREVLESIQENRNIDDIEHEISLLRNSIDVIHEIEGGMVEKDIVPVQLRKELECLKICSEVRTISDEVASMTGMMLRQVFHPLCDRLGITYRDIHYFRFCELVNALDAEHIDAETLNERRQFFLAYLSQYGEFIVEDGLLAKQKVAYLNKQFPNDNGNKEGFVEGFVAYPGRITGKVRVITSQIKGVTIEEGEVLIAPLTTVEFVPLMKKAAAIITDKGGLTSHAAIIAREFKKPCIVGTKNATRTFHDGDMVEVDADKGIVRIKSDS